MKNIKLFLLISIILSACSSSPSSILEETPTTGTIEPSAIPTFTPTPQPTNSPEPSPTATIDYQSLTTEEKIKLSQSYVEEANTYNGEVRVEVDVKGTTYNVYWDFVKNEWRSDHNTPAGELDKTGGSFPDLVILGYENPDGTLVFIDSETEREIVFPKPVIPGKGEISFQDFNNLSQTELGTYVIDRIMVPALDPANEDLVKRAEAMKQQALFLGGYICGAQNQLYAGIGGGTSVGNDFPLEDQRIYEEVTNQFCIPIYSPETGNFMFFLKIQQGNPVSFAMFEYDKNGNTKFHHGTGLLLEGKLPFSIFGGDVKDTFGIIVEHRDLTISHWEGGYNPLLQGNDGSGRVDDDVDSVSVGVGSVKEVELILNAQTEDEILKTLKQFKIFVSYPTRIAFPQR